MEVGVKVTWMEQDAPAARIGPHPFVSAKSMAFVPVMLIDVIVRVEPPVLLRVTGCASAVLPTASALKLRVDGLTTMGCPPVPESGMLWGEAGALSARLNVALRPLSVEGVKVMLIWQFAPAASVAGQLLV
jgi:hypothetical protein